jgi:hypothetical protein
MNVSSSSAGGVRGCSPLEFAALVYFCVPLLIFFLAFTAYAISVAAVPTIAIALYRLRPRVPICIGLGWRELLLCTAAAAIFLAGCGYTSSSARSWDWLKHFAMINELGQQPWPPVRSDTDTFLRFYLGYYLTPGLFVKLLGNRYINVFVTIQTWIGLSLILALLLQKVRPKRPIVFFAVFLLFSGLDLVGSLLFDPKFTWSGHKEWWAGFANYSYQGHATLFVWVPHHAIAGLLGLAIMLPETNRKPPPQIVAILGIAVLFWSPFAVLGLAPFVLAMTAGSWREGALDWGNILCGVVLGIPVVAYLSTGGGDIPQGINWRGDTRSFAMLAAFLMLEVGVYLIALRLCCWNSLRYPWLVIGVLLLLPLYRIGLFNDFTMRSCIPALGLLAIAVAYSLSEAKGYAWIPLACVVVIGSATSILEMRGRAREGYVPARDLNLRSGFLSEDKNFFVQYNAPLPHWVLRR